VSEKLGTPSQAKQPGAAAPRKLSSRNSIFAFAVFAVGLNAAAAVYTRSPSDFALPNVDRLAELLPQQRALHAMPDPVVAALKDIQSAQQQHAVALQDSGSSLQQNTALLLQDSTSLAALRQSVTDGREDVSKISAEITDEHVDVKKMSDQISTLIAKVDTLQNALAPQFTSSIPTEHAHHRPSGVMRKRMARQPKPVGPISAPLSFPALTLTPEG
jgi:hypothetical protein